MAKSNTLPLAPIGSIVSLRPKTNEAESTSEAKRLEQLWASDFGDAYVERNRSAGQNRASFWQAIMAEFPAHRVLEVGCNIGANLRWIAQSIKPTNTFGVDINHKAIGELHGSHPAINGIVAPARDIPFRDRWFDMVFTMGVLIHQPPETLPLVMNEVVRCSRRYVLCAEYFADDVTAVPYRGQTGALYKRDFGALYQDLFPELTLRSQGFLSKKEGWDDVTYWVFEKAF